MDPNNAWNKMLLGYATKQWAEAAEHAEALRDWLEAGGFPPQPTIGSTTGNLTCQLDAEFSAAICTAASEHVISRCRWELEDAS
ncbi:MAG: hypothetical protein R3C59_09895 [Planctomycetaceae bacterium]